MSMPSARYHLIRSGRYRRAPLAAYAMRCMPMVRLMLSSTAKSAMRQSSISQADGLRPSSRASETLRPMPRAQA